MPPPQATDTATSRGLGFAVLVGIVGFAVGVTAALITLALPQGRVPDLLYILVHQPGFVALVIVLLYFLFILIARAVFVSAPERSALRADIACLRARLHLLVPLRAGKGWLPQEPIKALLDDAETNLHARSLADRLLWSVGPEAQAAKRLDGAAALLCWSISEEEVTARLAAALPGLTGGGRPELTPDDLARRKKLADRIGSALAPRSRVVVTGRMFAHVLKCVGTTGTAAEKRALLERVGTEERAFSETMDQLLTWHGKTLWLTATGLLLIVTLVGTLGHWQLLLVGAAAAFLSRLWRAIRSIKLPTDYWSYWVTLMLAPIAGALAAYGGLLLLTLLQALGILGKSVSFAFWNNPSRPETLAVAFLLGFSERLLDRFATGAEGIFGKTTTTTSAEGAS